jgi:hypothetical protein
MQDLKSAPEQSDPRLGDIAQQRASFRFNLISMSSSLPSFGRFGSLPVIKLIPGTALVDMINPSCAMACLSLFRNLG